jgi:hypothetical protein
MKIYKQLNILVIFLFLLTLVANGDLTGKQIIEVRADEAKPEFLPPFLNLDVTVNVSSSAFDSVPNLINTDISVSSRQDNKITVQSYIKTMFKQDNSDYYLRIKLKGSEAEAKISSALDPESPIIRTEAIYISSLFTLSQINETNREEVARIGYENLDAPSESMTQDEYYKDKGYQLGVDDTIVTETEYYTSREKVAIGDVLVKRSESVEDRRKDLHFKDFLVTPNLRETSYLWVLEALGLDAFNETQARWVSSVLTASTPVIELPIPYDKALTDGILEDLSSGIASAASVVTGIAHGAGEFVSDTTGITLLEDMTVGAHTAVKEAEACAKKSFIDLLCPKAVNTFVGPIVTPVQEAIFGLPVIGEPIKFFSDMSGGLLGFVHGLVTNPIGLLKTVAVGILFIIVLIVAFGLFRSYLSGRARRAGEGK